MKLDKSCFRPVIERTLRMHTRGREHQCLRWAIWHWRQEIEIAVYRAKTSRL